MDGTQAPRGGARPGCTPVPAGGLEHRVAQYSTARHRPELELSGSACDVGTPAPITRPPTQRTADQGTVSPARRSVGCPAGVIDSTPVQSVRACPSASTPAREAVGSRSRACQSPWLAKGTGAGSTLAGPGAALCRLIVVGPPVATFGRSSRQPGLPLDLVTAGSGQSWGDRKLSGCTGLIFVKRAPGPSWRRGCKAGDLVRRQG
jgi:hypothetical protein